MKGKSKKVIAVAFVAVMLMIAFLGVISAVTIEDHTMCKGTEDSIVTVHGITGHAYSSVNETTEFYVTDSNVVCWVQIERINRGDTFRFEWYDPRDLLYQIDNSTTVPYFNCWFAIYSDMKKTSFKGYLDAQGNTIFQAGTVDVSPPQLGWNTCWLSRSLKIHRCPPANKIGNWHVDFYYKGEKQFTEYFTIYSSILQSMIDAANPGDTIIIEDGIYNENIKVNKRLTIRSENGSANCIVQAKDSNDPVFEVTADHVNISGFTVKGAYGNEKAGISLRNSDYSNISNNTCSNNNDGIYLWHSNNNSITGNNVINNDKGIGLDYSSNNKIYFNNFINNTYSVNSRGSTNIWNSQSKMTYTYNGSIYTNYLGNYWDDYKEKYLDADEINESGIWDTPYDIDSDKDNYPLIEPFEYYIAKFELI